MRIRYTKNLNVASVAFIQRSGEHDHTMLADNGLSSLVRKSIEEKDEPSEGMTARVIQRNIQVCSFFCSAVLPLFLKSETKVSGLQLPSVKQIQNQEAYRAQERGFSNKLSLEDLQNYYDDQKDVPGAFIYLSYYVLKP